MYLIFHVTSRDHLIEGSREFMEPFMENYHPVMFGVHRYCVSGDMFLVVEEEDSTCSRLNPPLPFISRAHGMPHTGKFRNVDIALCQCVSDVRPVFTLVTSIYSNN